MADDNDVHEASVLSADIDQLPNNLTQLFFQVTYIAKRPEQKQKLLDIMEGTRFTDALIAHGAHQSILRKSHVVCDAQQNPPV